MPEDLGECLRRETAKRDAMLDPELRWRWIQGFLTWVAQQPGAPDTSPAGCIAKERRICATLAAAEARKRSGARSDPPPETTQGPPAPGAS